MKSKVDILYRSLLITKFFVKGWGRPKVLQTLFTLRRNFLNRKNIEDFLFGTASVHINAIYQYKEHQLMRGEFATPLSIRYPFLVPKAARMAKFEIILPATWKDVNHKPICIHLAGTGDHFYWRRRRFMAKPLVKEAGIGAIILENPFYGSRKPQDQVRSNLHFVSDIFVMGACLILECYVLLKWCEKQGFGPLGVTGVSMGGHMASLAAAAWPKPIILVPCLSWTTAASVFTEGVMARSINWDLLSYQYYTNPAFSALVGWRLPNVTDATVTPAEIEKGILEHVKNVDPKDLASFQRFISNTKLNPRKLATSLWNSLYQQFMLKDTRDPTILEYMKLIMNECTDLRNFPKLVDPSLCIAICALHDAYVPREGCAELKEVWKGVDIRYIKTGHVSAILIYHYVFRKCIIEAFERARARGKALYLLPPQSILPDPPASNLLVNKTIP